MSTPATPTPIKTLSLGGSSSRRAQNKATIHHVAQLVNRAQRMLVVCGAGVSCSAGIPDFRSNSTGLYSEAAASFPTVLKKGQELFDAQCVFRSELVLRAFVKFMGRFKQTVDDCQPTKTHRWLAEQTEKGHIRRVYTQNIDGLEHLATGNSSKENDQVIVQLHGSVHRLRCTICHFIQPHLRQQTLAQFLEPPYLLPSCPHCENNQVIRTILQKRPLPQGFLRPDVVLYNESHPQASDISETMFKDARAGDLLLIMGTSLKVHGCRMLVKQLARGVKQKCGIVVFVNKHAIAWTEWRGIIDWWIEGECDEWIDTLLKCSSEKRLMLLPAPAPAPATSPKKKRKKREKKESPVSKTRLISEYGHIVKKKRSNKKI